MCPDCKGYGQVRKTAQNATEPGPLGMAQTCGRCHGTGFLADADDPREDEFRARWEALGGGESDA